MLPGGSLGVLSAGWVSADPIKPFFDNAASETTPSLPLCPDSSLGR